MLNCVSEGNLRERWDSLLEEYLSLVNTVQDSILKIDDIRKEMIMIREELLRRNIEVDEPPPPT